MAVDRLKSEQDRLCEWLSSDPDFILSKCDGMLFMNEYREIEKQSRALEKICVLLKIIIQKGEDTCQSFVDILKKHQEHYQQLQQFFNPVTQGSPSPTVVADSGSVVTARQLTNIKANSIKTKIETESGPGSSQPGNFIGQMSQATYMATGASVICADKICNATVDGDIDFSVTVKASHQGRAGAVDETLPSSQDPAVKLIREHKKELISCLSADCSFILQHVHAGNIITDRQYQNLMEISQSEKTVIGLIDQLMDKGPETCSLFLNVLKEPEVLSTYPQLKHIMRYWC